MTARSKFCFRFHIADARWCFFGTVGADGLAAQHHRRRASSRRRISASSRSRPRRAQDISFEAMVKLQAKVADVFAKSPYVAHVASARSAAAGGSSALNAGRLFVELKPKDAAPDRCRRCWPTCGASSAPVPGISTYMTPVQNLNDRRARLQEPVPVRRAEPRPGPDERLGAEARRRHEPRTAAYLHRRHHRPAEQRAAGDAGRRPRQGGVARHRRRRAALDALFRLRRRSRSRRSTRRATATR